jgi:LPS sulfotransferase NodH
MIAPPLTYLVCALPRSGGQLLARGLRDTGVVAAPEPWFWAGWRGHDACTRQQLRQGPETVAAAGTLTAIRAAGSAADSDLGFGAEVRWPELVQLLAALRLRPDGPGAAAGDEELLAAYLPGLRFVHLTREDKAAQAVAWWHGRHGRDRCRRTPALNGTSRRFTLDPAAVEQLERRLRADEWRWLSFFTRAGIDPLVVTYESLQHEPAAAVRRVLEFLDVPGAATADLPPAVEVVPDPGLVRAEREYQAWRRGRTRVDAHRVTAPVSVILTGVPGDLGPTVEAVRAATPGDVEIVVVDDRPRRPGAVIDCSGLAGARLVVPPEGHRPSPAAARNLGASRAAGDTLVFLDGRHSPEAGWLAPLRAALAGPSVAVAGPRAMPGTVVGPDDDVVGEVRRVVECPGGGAPVPVVDGGCMAVRRRDFEAVGGFDVGMATAALLDLELCLHLWRRGRRCVVLDDAPGRVPAATPDIDAGGGGVLHDVLRLATVHLGPDDLVPTFEGASRWSGFADVYRQLVVGDVFDRRRRVTGAVAPGEPWACERLPAEALP